jgi:hypothetical protein
VRGAFVVVCAIAAAAAAARADNRREADDLAARGEELAKQGEWTRAIEAFKAADAKHPRAKHACLVGLAYLRRELWAESELFLSICRQRASAEDPLPDWVDAADGQLRDKLAKAGAAAVTIDVAPPAALALVTVSSFAPDESFTPRTIHLAPGTYIVTAAAPGYRGARQELTIADASPRTVTLALEATARPEVATATRASSRAPWIVMAAGAAVIAGGFAVDAFAVQPVRSFLNTTPSSAAYLYRQPEFARDQAITLALWSVGGVVIGTGVAMRVMAARRGEPRVGVAISRGGGALTLEWSR